MTGQRRNRRNSANLDYRHEPKIASNGTQTAQTRNWFISYFYFCHETKDPVIFSTPLIFTVSANQQQVYKPLHVEELDSCCDTFLQLRHRWNALFVQAMNPFKAVTWHELKRLANHEQDALSSLSNFWRHTGSGKVVSLWHTVGILIDIVKV